MHVVKQMPKSSMSDFHYITRIKISRPFLKIAESLAGLNILSYVTFSNQGEESAFFFFYREKIEMKNPNLECRSYKFNNFFKLRGRVVLIIDCKCRVDQDFLIPPPPPTCSLTHLHTHAHFFAFPSQL